MKRRSGILIHPTSFPGTYGCGDLGDNAYKMVDILESAGQTILQTLPLGPTGFGDSPYQSFSAFAGSPYLISFDYLIKKGYLEKSDLDDYPDFDKTRVDYGGIYIHNFKILRRAYKKFKTAVQGAEYKTFVEENAFWLDDYALFMAIKDSKSGADWSIWEEELRLRTGLDSLSEKIYDDADFYKFVQYEFYIQWENFRKYANDKGILIIGDAPIFVSYDSADVWANQELFHLDHEGKPEVVAGVPPDYFSAVGQLWGNPHYKWKKMKKNGFAWWKKRIDHCLKLVDSLRIDHFRGFEAYWEIAFGAETAVNGQWVKAPGKDLFKTLKKEYGKKLEEDIIAEDLGIITPEVRKLRDEFKLPGMRIFQFAPFTEGTFDDEDGTHDNSEHMFLPDNYIENSIAYTGTHDNDVLLGWFESAGPEEQQGILKYLGISDKKELPFAAIEKVMSSQAKWTIFPLQDVLELGNDARMNLPGSCGSMNWSWRVTEELLKEKSANFEKLAGLTGKAQRG